MPSFFASRASAMVYSRSFGSSMSANVNSRSRTQSYP